MQTFVNFFTFVSDWQGEPRAARGPCLHSLSWWSVRWASVRKNHPEISGTEQQRRAVIFLIPWRDQSKPLQAAVQEPDEQHRADGGGEGGRAGRGRVRLRVKHSGETTGNEEHLLQVSITENSIKNLTQFHCIQQKQERKLIEREQAQHQTLKLLFFFPPGFWWLAKNVECHNWSRGPIKEQLPHCQAPTLPRGAVHCWIVSRLTGHDWSGNLCLIDLNCSHSEFAHGALSSLKSVFLLYSIKSLPGQLLSFLF